MNNDWNLLPDVTEIPLRAALRPAPALAPEDSLGRFIQTIRHLPATELPVIQDGRLRGMVSLNAALATLGPMLPQARERLLQRPLSEILTPPAVVAGPEMRVEEIGNLFARHGVGLIPVVDRDGYCLGIVLASDLLCPDLPRPKPAVVGGMATPFGVYLTDGTNQAGVGNLALVATGVLMALLFAIPGGGILALVNLGLARHVLPDALFADPLPGQSATFAATLVSTLLTVLIFGLFLLLMRFTRLAGYHAAEHQMVHAIERDEPLVPHVVARMPRPHPRCGTNLMAAGFLFGTTFQLLNSVPEIGANAYIIAFFVTILFWRRVGTFLQAYLTTRPASEKQLESGIAAGEAILEKYLTCPPFRPKPFRRIWCMGLLQVLFGTTVTSGLLWFLQEGYTRLVAR